MAELDVPSTMSDVTELHIPAPAGKDPEPDNVAATDSSVLDAPSSTGNDPDLDISEAREDDDSELNEHRLAFVLFDHDRDLKLNFEELKLAVRSLGVIATEEEFDDFRRKLHRGSDSSGFDYADFMAAVARLYGKAARRREDDFRSNDVMVDLTECFARLDSEETGSVSVKELRRVLTTFGEALTQEEIDSVLDAGDLVTDGKVQYSKFIDLLLSNPFRSVE